VTRRRPNAALLGLRRASGLGVRGEEWVLIGPLAPLGGARMPGGGRYGPSSKVCKGWREPARNGATFPTSMGSGTASSGYRRCFGRCVRCHARDPGQMAGRERSAEDPPFLRGRLGTIVRAYPCTVGLRGGLRQEALGRSRGGFITESKTGVTKPPHPL